MRTDNTDIFRSVSSEGIEINPQFQTALDILENSRHHLLVTGKAGTGKSTFLDYFRKKTDKNVAVLAPTGVAAVNVRGETIHSFFRFRPDITPEKVKRLRFKDPMVENIYKLVDVIVIDEISMVRADLLDCVDRALRLYRGRRTIPFGGCQMVFIGDLHQLPPVVANDERQIFSTRYSSEYFFSADVMTQINLDFVELDRVYRQTDETFIQLLNGIRNNCLTENELERINARYQPGLGDLSGSWNIHLTTTNIHAQNINNRRLVDLKGTTQSFPGEVEGDFNAKALPTETMLYLKEGAQVMLLNNDISGRWVNGTLGRVHGYDKENILIQLSNGSLYSVAPHTWELFRFKWNQEEEKLESESVGKFKQYPLRLAWAVTVHKAQGKTFDQVVIDLTGGVFAPGQAYVAFSRCRSLEGIHLKKPLRYHHIMVDDRINEFMREARTGGLKGKSLFMME